MNGIMFAQGFEHWMGIGYKARIYPVDIKSESGIAIHRPVRSLSALVVFPKPSARWPDRGRV